jgi:septal ring factor EnvC (AmiA/AmiB activator)
MSTNVKEIFGDMEGKPQAGRNRRLHIAIILLCLASLMTSLILGYFLFDAQKKIDYERGRFDAALDTISQKNGEIQSYQADVETANACVNELQSANEAQESKINSLQSDIDSLNSVVGSQNSQIDSLNSKVSQLSTLKITRVDVQNNNCRNSFIFVDGVLAAGTRANGHTYFYVPPGSYSIQACSEPSRTNCGSTTTMNMNVSVFTLTIYKHPSCG